MSKKEPEKMIEDLLKKIDDDLCNATLEINAGSKNEAKTDIAKARGRIENFLMIMGYLQ